MFACVCAYMYTGLESMYNENETRKALASYAPELTHLQIRSRESERFRKHEEDTVTQDPVLRKMEEEEEEALILDIRADDVAQGL